VRLCVVDSFLDVFAKLHKATISFVMSVCPSVRPTALNNSVPTEKDFQEILCFEYFSKIC